MSDKASFQGSSSISSVLYRILPSFSTGSRPFFSQVLMISTFFVLLVAFLPYVSSSPTPSLTPIEPNNNNNNNKVIHDSNAFMPDPIDYQTNSRGDSSASSSSSSVHEQQISAPSSSVWFGQPRTHANQFLMSHVNDNEIVVPKWSTRLNNNDDDDDDVDDYVPSDISVNKRSSFYNIGGYQTLKKRKQLPKPPMEVMNEIVNSIYLKR